MTTYDDEPEDDLGGSEYAGEHPDEDDVDEQPHPDDEADSEGGEVA